MDQNAQNYPEHQNQGYQPYYQEPSYSMPGQRQAVNQYLNQVNYANAYNQNLMYQQSYQLEAMNQQMNQVAQEKEELQRQLMQQRQFAMQARQRQAPNSRQKEVDALSMLANFQRSLGGGRSDPLSLFDDAENVAEPRRGTSNRHRQYSNDYYPPPSRNNFDNRGYQIDRPSGSLERGPFGYNQGVIHQSPFQNAANMMINPVSPGYQGMYQPPMDPYMGQPWGDYPPPEPKKEPGSRTAEILMASLEKQNQILSDLTGSINKDRDSKVTYEAKEIENKIKQLEFESQAKQYQLFNHNILDALSKNYNRPINEVNLQKHSDLQPGASPSLMSPAQMLQLQAVMGPNRNMFGAGNPFSVMPSELMKHQQKIQDKKERERNKERKKKQKLKELLLLLGEDNGDEDEDEVLPTQGPADTGKKRASGAGKRKDDPDMKALNDEKARLEEEKRKKEEEEAKKKRIMKLRAKMWLRLYPLMYYLEFYAKKTKEREAAYAVLSERIGTNMENTKVWATKATAKGFEMVTGNSKLNLSITTVAGKKVTPKDAESRLQDIQKIIKAIMDGLINNTKTEIIPAQLLSFLGDISQDYTYPPQSYLFNFELNRLNFTHNGSLKDTIPPRVQMICAFFIMIRMFIAEMLLQPNKVNPSLKITDSLMRNFKTIASILTITIVDYLRSRLIVQNQNQKHLDPEIVIKPRSNPITFTSPVDLKDEGGEEDSGKKPGEQEIIIAGLYTKEQLSLFYGKKQAADEIKALVEGWCNSIEELVTAHHKEEVKAKRAAKAS